MICAFKRGRRFGTILVDLSNHQVIDLLAERSTKSAADWMGHHPEIEYVSRDRGNEYAQAAREGASQATPVADRFHLVKNLVEAIEPVVARCSREMRKVQEPLPEPHVPKVKEWRPARSPALEHHYQSRLAEKQERFDSMSALQKLGIPQDEVARRLGVTVRTVQNWNKQGSWEGEQASAQATKSLRSLCHPRSQKVEGRVQKKVQSCIERSKRRDILERKDKCITFSKRSSRNPSNSPPSPS